MPEQHPGAGISHYLFDRRSHFRPVTVDLALGANRFALAKPAFFYPAGRIAIQPFTPVASAQSGMMNAFAVNITHFFVSFNSIIS
jgi:hypothetical protein